MIETCYHELHKKKTAKFILIFINFLHWTDFLDLKGLCICPRKGLSKIQSVLCFPALCHPGTHAGTHVTSQDI